MNNKIKLFGIALVAVLAVATFGAGTVFAQSPTPRPAPGRGYGSGGMMGGRGSMMGSNGGMMGGYAQNGSITWETMNAMHQWMTTSGGMHTFVWNALAEKLSLTSDQLTAELKSGKTITQIAQAKGISRTDLVATLEVAHKASLAQAVSSSALTQAQADSILAQMAGRYEWMIDNIGFGAGYGMMGGQYGAGGCHGNWNNSTTNQQPKP